MEIEFIMHVQKVLFGNQVLYRGFCEACQEGAIIIDGEMQCCDAMVDKIDITTTVRACATKKNRSLLGLKIRRRILIKQDFMCIYCDGGLDDYVRDKASGEYIAPKVHFDHFVPWSYSGDNDESNMVASCSRCNLHKNNKMFNTIDGAREYIMKKRGKRYEKI